MKMRLRQRRAIVPASLSRLFAPLLQFEKWEIHTVFLHFSSFELEQKSWLSLLVKLCGVALGYFSENRPEKQEMSLDFFPFCDKISTI